MAVIANPNDPNAQKITQQQTGPTGAPLQTIGTAAPAGQAPAGGAQAKPQQGSGRFTNLQKYLGANKTAGQQVAGSVGQGLQKQFGEQSNKAQGYYNQLGTSIDQAKGEAAKVTGVPGDPNKIGYQQQLQNIGKTIQAQKIGPIDETEFNNTYKAPEQTGPYNMTQTELDDHRNKALSTYKADQEIKAMNKIRPGQDQDLGLQAITGFVENPEFANYQRFQSGQAIDENLMSLQQQKANQSALAAAQGAQQAQQALGTESGRFNLLRQQFASGPRSGYTQGQQRLDQVFLGQGGGLAGLQAQTSEQARKDLALAKQASGRQGEVNTLASQEQGLISGLNTQAQANEKAYVDALASYGGATQELRNRDYDALGKSLSGYVDTLNPTTKEYQPSVFKSDSGLNADQMARLGLNDKNTGVYNVFKDEAFRTNKDNNVALAKNIAEQGRAVDTSSSIATARDVATDADAKRYAALAKMMKTPSADQITGASTIDPSWTAKTGESGLKERLQKAQESYGALAKKNITVTGNGMGVGDTVYATPDELLQKNMDAARMKDYSSGGDYSLSSPIISETLRNQQTASLKNAYKDFLAQQNYNQTLGGKRETFLDTEAAAALAKQGITPKLNPTPVTEVDPNIAYRNALMAKAKGE